jgi:hypothetical protein
MSNPIIFFEGIVCPPSESLALRSVWLHLTVLLKKDIDFLLETEKQNKDIYYKWIKRTYLTDFISELVEVEEEVRGLRIGEQAKKRPCLSFDRVSYDNLQQIISILS